MTERASERGLLLTALHKLALMLLALSLYVLSSGPTLWIAIHAPRQIPDNYWADDMISAGPLDETWYFIYGPLLDIVDASWDVFADPFYNYLMFWN